MNIQVEVIKTDFPGEVNALRCKMEALRTGELQTNTSQLVQAEGPSLPTFSFQFKKASTHAALLFTALSNNEERGRCVYPLTFNSRMVRLLGPVVSPALARRLHVAHITNRIPGLEVEKVEGRVWFKIAEFKPSKRSSQLDPNGSWMNIETVQSYLEPPAEPVPPKPDIAALVSKEVRMACTSPVPDKSATLFVLFHSATTKIPELASKDILPITCIGSSTDIKEDALFTQEDGFIHTLPILKAVTVNCDTGTTLELHLASSDCRSLYFSAACQLSDLLPFRHYNWEYNWRWLPGVTGFSSEQSRGNLEPNLMVSVVCRPPLADYPDYEGLEVFVDKVEFTSHLQQMDLVLCCQLEKIEEAKFINLQLSGQELDEQNRHNFNLAVIQYSPNSNEEPVRSSAYFFFPSQSAVPGRQKIILTLYAVTHNAELWWKAESNSTAIIDLTEPVMQALSQSENRDGVRWKLRRNAIVNRFESAFSVTEISGIVKWKSPNNKFLSESAIAKISDLPLLSYLLNQLYARTGGLDCSDVMWKEAVARIGSDVLKLREEVKILKKENREYEKYILDMEASVVVTAADQSNLQHLTKSDLIHRVVELSERLNKETQVSKSSQNKVRGLQNSLIKQNEIESQYAELQEAHTAQQKVLRELQAKVVKYRKCMDTVKQQESVINKLEVLVARDMRDPTGKEAVEVLSRENARLRAELGKYQATETDKWEMGVEREKTIETLKDELAKLRNRCHDLEGEVAFLSKRTGVNSSAYRGEKDRVEELERKLEVALVREKAVMDELRESAVKWAKDKAKQELEIAQLRKGNADSSPRMTWPPSQASVARNISEGLSQNPSMIASPGSREKIGFAPSPPSPLQLSTRVTASPQTPSDLETIPTPLPTPQGTRTSNDQHRTPGQTASGHTAAGHTASDHAASGHRLGPPGKKASGQKVKAPAQKASCHTRPGHRASGHTASGHTMSGHTMSGHTASGHRASGHTASGHTTGHTRSDHHTAGHTAASGHTVSGVTTSGHITSGHITSSHLASNRSSNRSRHMHSNHDN